MNQRSSPLSCTIDLPENFRLGDVLEFHGRDHQALAERIDENSLQKGLMWGGWPACLTICFSPRQAQVCLVTDGRSEVGPAVLAQKVQHMLGLHQGVEAFEARHWDHPQLGALIARQSGLRVPLAATPFEALTWAIIGQQVSIAAAISLRRKFIRAAGCSHSSGLFCYPDAEQVVRLDVSELRQAGFSQTKAQALLLLSRAVAENRLPLEAWLLAPPVEEIREHLLGLRGIGPWTVNYALLRGFGWLDGSLHGDVAVRRGLQSLLGAAEKLTELQAREWLAPFSPWRALVAAHLWAWSSQSG
jgi:DNA-3-methyladenine glycosylase II